MKKFLNKVLWFLLPVLVFLIVVEAFVRSAPNDYRFKWSYLENHAKDIEVLILGNSQSYYGIDCKYIQQRSFNMAMEGQGLLIDDYILTNFMEEMTDLEFVILPMSYLSLTQPAAFGAPDRLMQYHIYYGYDSKWFSTDNYECLCFQSCRHKLVSLASGESLKIVDSLGCNMHQLGSFRDEADETLSWATGGGQELVKANSDALVHMAKICKESNVNLVLVTFPTDISYLNSRFYDVAQMEQVKNIADNLSSEYDNVFWLDWLENREFEISDFFDSSHLNEKGAQKMTSMLASTLERIKVQPERQ